MDERFTDEEVRHTFHLGDGDTLQVVVTDEGLIVDAFRDGELVGTLAQLATDLFDDLT